jgi:hypothetical protein
MRRLLHLLGLVCGLLATLLGGVGPARAESDVDVLETPHYRLEYAPSVAGQANRLVGSLESWHTRIYAELGAEAKGTTIITLMPDERDMFAAVSKRHPGSRPPEWASGLAFPARRTIFLRGDVPAEELIKTTQHEISHVALGSVTGEGTHVPIWFNEGVAIRQSEPVAFERIWLMTEAAMVDQLLPLSELDRGYPEGGGRVGVGYAQSVHFVGYLISRHGEARFQSLVRALGAPEARFESAVEQVYGRPLAGIESEWRDSLSFWWGWIPVVALGASMWVLLGLLLVWAWRRRRREQSTRMRDLAGLEAVDMAEDIEIAHDLRPPGGSHDPYHGRPPSIH